MQISQGQRNVKLIYLNAFIFIFKKNFQLTSLCEKFFFYCKV